MYSMDDLLHLLHSDGADSLQLRVGPPPVVILDGEPKKWIGVALTLADVEHLLHSITESRQRREFREHERIEFLYRFRHRASFVVCACMKGEEIQIDVH